MRTDSIHEVRNRRIKELGSKYWQKIQGEAPSLFDQQYWHGQLLEWVMKDEAFKIDAFRFVDVLPALHSTAAVSSHVRDYLLKEDRNLPVTVRSALKMAAGGIASPLAARAIRANVTEMARRFICESEGGKALKVFTELAEENLTFTADILGEATTSDTEAEEYLWKYFDLVDLLSEAAELWPEKPILHRSPVGPLPMANVSVKISALDPYLDAADLDGSVARLSERLLPLMREAKEKNVFLNFDLEQWAVHEITYTLFEKLALHPDLVDWPHLGLVLQSYLRTSDQDCDRLLDLSRKRGTPFTIRLVKGAYWDYEVVHARQDGFSCPVFTNKGLTDANYENLSVKLIDNHTLVSPAFAGHNLRSLVHAMVVAEEKSLDKSAMEIQMLYGMAEPLRRALAGNGYRVRIYAPIGELLPGMAYLVRRLLENTSNSGFLRQSYHDGVEIGSMLDPPSLEPEAAWERGLIPGDLASPFVNTSLLDFCEAEVRDSFGVAVANVQRRLPLAVPMVIGGREVMTEETVIHVSPNNSDIEVGRVSRALIADAEKAVASALKAFPAWRDSSLRLRAELIEHLAGQMEEDRFELAALQTHESGKPWREADADVAEAIDFCRYYARQALKELEPVKQGTMPGEDNVLFYEGRGPTAVIAPWNFPLAILCGMTTAALVAGNTVLIKPATAASATAYRFYQHLTAAGVGPDVAQFLPGAGEEIGNFLVGHPAVAQIAFTGSKEVGLGIIEQAGRTGAGQAEVKRVVCEMGGKNAIIVDEDADIDAALKGVLQSAFGYAGQKCSACSRLILVGQAYNLLLPRLLESCRSLPVRPATDPACRLGPVIERKAHERLIKLITAPPPDSILHFTGNVPDGGYFVPVTVFEVAEASHQLMQQEIFGPVLTVIRVLDLPAALNIANSTEFALTGALYSRSPSNIALARTRFKVGNLYINRGCTGALVGRQPFGGFGMSGIGTKAGGPGYLFHFAHPRCVAENTMRSGFTPELQL